MKLNDFYLTREKFTRFLKFVKILRVEPYLLLMSFQFGLKATPISQMVEDKICMHWYNTTDKYCYDLPSLDEHGDGFDHFKSKILTDSALFGTYVTYIITGPTIVWMLFCGNWIDRYVKGRKILMVMGISSAVMVNIMLIILTVHWKTSIFYNLLAQIPPIIFGGDSNVRLALTHYVSSTTPPNLMSLRFMIYELCFLVSFPVGQALGGFILVQKPFFKTGELRNYTMIFILSLILEVCGLLWIIFMVDESVARKHEMKAEMKIRGIRGPVSEGESKIILKSEMSREDKTVHPIRLLFDLENVKQMVRTAIKKRPNNVRLQLVFLFTGMFVFIMHISGTSSVQAQFTQKIYLWKPDWSSYMSALSLVIHGMATITIVPILVRVFKVGDIPLAIIGFCLLFAIDILKGSWLTALAFYMSMPAGAIAGMCSVGIRSYLTKVVDRNEIGKIVSFMSTVDTLAPIISSAILVYVFKYTIDTYPGTVYQMIAFIILIPILMLMWIDIYTDRPLTGKLDETQNKSDRDVGTTRLGLKRQLSKALGYYDIYELNHEL